MQSSSALVMESIIKGALRYPSGDNCQPFYFKIIGDDCFEIIHIENRAAHRANFENRASVLTLGTLFTAIEVVAAHYQYRVFFSELPADLNNPVWSKVRIVPDVLSMNEFTIDEVDYRHTDRRPYSNQPVNDVLRNQLIRESNNEYFSFYFGDQISEPTVQALLNIEEEVWKDSLLGQDVLSWIRFDEISAATTLDGMTFESLGISRINKPFLKLFKGRPDLHRIFTQWGSTKSNRKVLQGQLLSSGGFGWYFVSDAALKNLIEVGKSMMRNWFRINRAGYSFQPITFAPLGSFCQRFGLLPPDWPNQLNKHYSEFRTVLAAEFPAVEAMSPVWGFRAGYVDGNRYPYRQYRRNFEDIKMK